MMKSHHRCYSSIWVLLLLFIVVAMCDSGEEGDAEEEIFQRFLEKRAENIPLNLNYKQANMQEFDTLRVKKNSPPVIRWIGCKASPPNIPHGTSKFRDIGMSLLITCDENYKTQFNSTSISLKCFSDEWHVMNSPIPISADEVRCLAQCNPSCENNGLCVKEGESMVCKCSKNYTGKVCELGGCDKMPNLPLAFFETRTHFLEDETTIPPEVLAKCHKGAFYTFQNLSGYQNTTPPDVVKLQCHSGDWRVVVPGTRLTVRLDTVKCAYKCNPPCFNGGVCTEIKGDTKICKCPREFTGPQCRIKKCKDDESLMLSTRKEYKGYVWKTCPEGYVHTSNGNRSYVVTCVNGKWETPKGECKPVCIPPCLNNGTCGALNTCNCLSDTTGVRCEKRNCVNAATRNINDADHTVDHMQLTITCHEGYKFSTGASRMIIPCADGKWNYSGISSLSCLAECEKPCLNGGTCESPNLCSCPPGYTGNQCELETCPETPKFIYNAVANISDTIPQKYNLQCNSGYKLYNNKTSLEAICDNGRWNFPKGFQSTFIVACRPHCDPPCFNGGRCIANNTCRCPEGFFGESCTKRYIKSLHEGDCAFPFSYRGKWYYSCTTDYYHLPWCATQVTESNELVKWSICKAEIGMTRVQMTESGLPCQFPFMHQEKMYYTCVEEQESTPWCAIEVDINRASIRTSSCEDHTLEVQDVILTTGGYICDPDYLPGGPKYDKMIHGINDYGTCDVLVQDAFGNNVEDFTAMMVLIDSGTRRNVLTESGKKCIFPFTVEGETFYSCTSMRNKPYWCPTQVDEVGNILKDDVCVDYCIIGRQVRQLTLTNVAPAGSRTRLRGVPLVSTLTGDRCIFPFVHKGKTYHECVYVGSEMPWCATMIDDERNAIARASCARDWDHHSYREHMLKVYVRSFGFPMSVSGLPCVPFIHNGKQTRGCVKEEGKMPWCAVQVNSRKAAVATEICVSDYEEYSETSVKDPEFIRYVYMLFKTPKAPFLDPSYVEDGYLLYTEVGEECVPSDYGVNGIQHGCIKKQEGDDYWCALQVDDRHFPLIEDKCPRKWLFWRYFLTLKMDYWSPCLGGLDIVLTQTGEQCVFPFMYDGKMQRKCVVDASGRQPWCATLVDRDGKILRKATCLDSQGNVVRSASGRICVPFLKNGYLHEGCVVSPAEGRPWCAVTVDSNGRLLEKDFCNSDWKPLEIAIPEAQIQGQYPEQLVRLHATDGRRCVPFIYNDAIIPYCTNDEDNNPFCAVAVNEIGHPTATAPCLSNWREIVWPPATKLVEKPVTSSMGNLTVSNKSRCLPFVLGDRMIFGCVTPTHGYPFCAVKVDKNSRPLKTEVCRPDWYVGFCIKDVNKTEVTTTVQTTTPQNSRATRLFQTTLQIPESTPTTKRGETDITTTIRPLISTTIETKTVPTTTTNNPVKNNETSTPVILVHPGINITQTVTILASSTTSPAFTTSTASTASDAAFITSTVSKSTNSTAPTTSDAASTSSTASTSTTSAASSNSIASTTSTAHTTSAASTTSTTCTASNAASTSSVASISTTSQASTNSTTSTTLAASTALNASITSAAFTTLIASTTIKESTASNASRTSTSSTTSSTFSGSTLIASENSIASTSSTASTISTASPISTESRTPTDITSKTTMPTVEMEKPSSVIDSLASTLTKIPSVQETTIQLANRSLLLKTETESQKPHTFTTDVYFSPVPVSSLTPAINGSAISLQTSTTLGNLPVERTSPTTHLPISLETDSTPGTTNLLLSNMSTTTSPAIDKTYSLTTQNTSLATLSSSQIPHETAHPSQYLSTISETQHDRTTETRANTYVYNMTNVGTTFVTKSTWSQISNSTELSSATVMLNTTNRTTQTWFETGVPATAVFNISIPATAPPTRDLHMPLTSSTATISLGSAYVTEGRNGSTLASKPIGTLSTVNLSSTNFSKVRSEQTSQMVSPTHVPQVSSAATTTTTAATTTTGVTDELKTTTKQVSIDLGKSTETTEETSKQTLGLRNKTLPRTTLVPKIHGVVKNVSVLLVEEVDLNVSKTVAKEITEKIDLMNTIGLTTKNSSSSYSVEVTLQTKEPSQPSSYLPHMDSTATLKSSISATESSTTVPGVLINASTTLSTIKNENATKTVDNQLCVFPFVWKNLTCDRCSRVDSPAPWCATRVNELGQPVTSSYCQDTLVGPVPKDPPPTVPSDTPLKHDRCVFPFVYKGMTYYNCTLEDSMVFWCAAEVDVYNHPTKVRCCSDEKRTVALNSEVKPAANNVTVFTMNGRECLFPFQHEGEWHNTCIQTSKDEHPWCVTRTDPFGKPIFIGFCQNNTGEPLPPPQGFSNISTENGCTCKFPFRFKDRWYVGCTMQGQEKLWCATSTTKEGDVLKTGFCQHVQHVCSRKLNETISGVNCVFPFVFGHVRFDHCTTYADTKPWCATKVNSDLQVQSFDYCKVDDNNDDLVENVRPVGVIENGPLGPTIKPVVSDVKTVSQGNCVFPFNYKGIQYKHCTCIDAPSCWCATSLTTHQEPATSDYCNDLVNSSSLERPPTVGEKQKLTFDGRPCVLPFEYKGVLYTRCTTEDSTHHWCATLVNEERQMIKSAYCRGSDNSVPPAVPSPGCKEAPVHDQTVLSGLKTGMMNFIQVFLN